MKNGGFDMQNPKMQITFTPTMLDKLKQMANESGNSISSVVRVALSEYIKKVEEVDK